VLGRSARELFDGSEFRCTSKIFRRAFSTRTHTCISSYVDDSCCCRIPVISPCPLTLPQSIHPSSDSVALIPPFPCCAETHLVSFIAARHHALYSNVPLKQINTNSNNQVKPTLARKPPLRRQKTHAQNAGSSRRNAVYEHPNNFCGINVHE
jgi:hypothetical protein